MNRAAAQEKTPAAQADLCRLLLAQFPKKSEIRTVAEKQWDSDKDKSVNNLLVILGQIRTGVREKSAEINRFAKDKTLKHSPNPDNSNDAQDNPKNKKVDKSKA